VSAIEERTNQPLNIGILTLSLKMQVSVPTDILMRELDGESVILNLKSERYFGLDEVGTRMWAALSTSESVQAAYESLLSEYDVDAQMLQRDLDDLLQKLVEHGLVEVSDG
jgi:hypothetical protein